MEKKKILLTGDDGYNSIGTRLLIALLRDDFDLTIAATKSQQSAIGGKISMKEPGEWKETAVDGIAGFYVDGTPVDAMECAKVWYPNGFDLVISGMNMGLNIGGAIVSSGTVSAALRAVSLQVAPVSLAMSWDVSPSMFFHDHTGDDEISHTLQYPGKNARELILAAFAQNFWGGNVVNINFPKTGEFTGKIRMTKLAFDAQFWPPVEIDSPQGTYVFPRGDHEKNFPQSTGTDIGAICDGEISVSACQWNLGSDMDSELIGKELAI